MKRKFSVLLFVIILCYLVSSSSTAQNAPELQQRLEKINTYINTVLKEWNAAGIGVGIVKDGEVIFSEGFGLRNVEEKLPVTPNTLFVLASVTKPFVTAAMSMLVDDGLLDWDTPVRTYLPGFMLKNEYATGHITPRDMAVHRSGLPRHDHIMIGTNYTPEKVVEVLRHLEPSCDFRSRYQYNNLMYIAAGHLIGKVTGKTWDEIVRERIFRPLGMEKSNCSIRELKETKDFARGYFYNRNKEQFELISFPPPSDILFYGPRASGSINSSINDMNKWLQFQLNRGQVNGKNLISPDNFLQMHTPQIVKPFSVLEKSEVMHPSDGIGWEIDSYRGHYRVHQGGASAIQSYASELTLFPHENLGIVVLTNAYLPLTVALSNFISDVLLDLEPVDWNKRYMSMWFERRSAGREEPAEAIKPEHIGTRLMEL